MSKLTAKVANCQYQSNITNPIVEMVVAPTTRIQNANKECRSIRLIIAVNLQFRDADDENKEAYEEIKNENSMSDY